jgi:hypothetical protein
MFHLLVEIQIWLLDADQPELPFTSAGALTIPLSRC